MLFRSSHTFTIQAGLRQRVRGDHIQIKFTQSTDDDDTYFKIKDVVLYFDEIPKRETLNDLEVYLPA